VVLVARLTASPLQFPLPRGIPSRFPPRTLSFPISP